jgi:hypothetical protein
MSETDEQFKKALTQKISESEDIKVTVDNEHTKSLEQRALKAEEEAEDLKTKLGIIAEKELDKRRKAVVEKVNSTFKDSGKRAEMLDKVANSNPQQLSAMDSMLDAFSEQLGKKSFEPSGSAPINPQQLGNQGETDLAHRKFNSVQEAYQTLLNIQKTGSPQEATEAKRLADLMLQKGIRDYIELGHPSGRYCEDDKIEKKNVDPTVNLSEYKPSDFSEIRRFGVKNAIPNYAKTHNPDGSEK